MSYMKHAHDLKYIFRFLYPFLSHEAKKQEGRKTYQMNAMFKRAWWLLAEASIVTQKKLNLIFKETRRGKICDVSLRIGWLYRLVSMILAQNGSFLYLSQQLRLSCVLIEFIVECVIFINIRMLLIIPIIRINNLYMLISYAIVKTCFTLYLCLEWQFLCNLMAILDFRMRFDDAWVAFGK